MAGLSVGVDFTNNDIEGGISLEREIRGENGSVFFGPLGDPGKTEYTGKGLFGSNFIGKGPKGNPNPYTILEEGSEEGPDAKYLKPLDELDEGAQEHDYANHKAETGGLDGLLKRNDLLKADVALGNVAQKIIDGYKNGAIDRVTHVPISERTYNMARIVRAALFPVIIKKSIN